MNQNQYTNIAFGLAVLLSIGFPLFGVLTTKRFKHRLEKVPSAKMIIFWCFGWMSFVGLLGSTFEWWEGMIRYSGESLQLLSVQQEDALVLNKDIQRTRGSGNRTRYWITTSTPNQERIRVSKLYYESVAINQVMPIAYTTAPKVYWPVEDTFAIKRFADFLFCYSFIIFCSYGFFAFARMPDTPPSDSVQNP